MRLHAGALDSCGRATNKDGAGDARSMKLEVRAIAAPR